MNLKKMGATSASAGHRRILRDLLIGACLGTMGALLYVAWAGADGAWVRRRSAPARY